MKGLLFFVQFIAAIALVISVLLHAAKGEGLGGIGGTAHLFGTPKGMEEGLDKITWSVAIAFLAVSFLIALVK